MKSRILCTSILAGLVLITPFVQAGVYKWVDENGKVHFSDKPPEGSKAKKQDIKSNSTRSGGTGFFGTKSARQQTPVTYSGTELSRRVRLETILIDLEKDTGERTIIGKEYYGITCKETNRGLTWSQGTAEVSGKKYRQSFNQILTKYKYLVEDHKVKLFAEQKREPAELSMAATITELQVNRCRQSRYGSGNSKVKEKIASYVKVKWSVFDILERKVIFEKITEGSDSNAYDTTVGDGQDISRFKSFRRAVTNLLADKSFVALLQESKLSASGPILAKTANLPLKLHYGARNGDFTGRIDALKNASVTVRSVIGHGSGFILTREGHVITNAHVLGDSEQAIVVFNNREVHAKVIRIDDKRDVALLKLVGQEGGQPVMLSSRKAVEGEVVYVIGTPLDEKFSQTVTRGIISAYRTLEDGNEYYQTDAAINPGNSGGPVFNQYGEVVAVAVSGLFTRGGSSLNINFLIPINEALDSLGVIY